MVWYRYRYVERERVLAASGVKEVVKERRGGK
jgi:hypothetical protein